MKKGFVTGKFEPLTLGHLGLIEFAKSQCDILHVLLASNDKYETIPGEIRYKWLEEYFSDRTDIIIDYTNVDLPYTSVSNRDVSKVWADYFKRLYPEFDCIISSEPYGDYVAEYMNIEHIMFDQKRMNIPISATQIRDNPYKYWEYIPEIVKPYFVKKVCICGTESTGKSTLTRDLASYYRTNYVPEWGRYIVPDSIECTEHMLKINGELQAKDINRKIKYSNKILFSDTDINTTKIYGKYLFNKDIEFDENIMKANQFDLYLYLDENCDFIQDGTRLQEEERNELSELYYQYYKDNNIKYFKVSGDWGERYQNALEIINTHFNI